jgi:hypothetical protein
LLADLSSESQNQLDEIGKLRQQVQLHSQRIKELSAAKGK